MDIFLEIFGVHSLAITQQTTVAKAHRQGNNDFDVSEQELKGFFGLCKNPGCNQRKRQTFAKFLGSRIVVGRFLQK